MLHCDAVTVCEVDGRTHDKSNDDRKSERFLDNRLLFWHDLFYRIDA